MMWRLLGPGGPQDYWRHAEWDELGNAARFSVDEKFRGDAYKKMTKIFLEHFPWIPDRPALRGLRAAEVRGVDAGPAAAARDPSLQLQVPPGLIPASHCPLPGSGGEGRVRGLRMRAFLLFLAGRAGRALVALWLVSTVVFVVMRLSGDPTPLLLPPDAPQSEIFRLRAELGLDRSLPVQYAVFLGNLVRGDFGQSIRFKAPALAVVTERLPATARARAHVVRPRHPRRHSHRAALRRVSQHPDRSRGDGPRPGGPVRARRSSSASCSSCSSR